MRNFVLAAITSLGLLLAASTSRADDVVHVKADAPVVIQTQTPDGWRSVCEGECSQPLPKNATYRVEGARVRPSAPFQLASKPGSNVFVAVNTRPRGAYTAGVVLTTIGSVLLVGSTVLLGVAYANDGGWAALAAAVYAGLVGTVGIATLVPGIVLMAHNAHSRVEQQPLPERTAIAPRGSAVSVPILSGHF